MENNGWSEWQNHVLVELKRLSTAIETLEKSTAIYREKTTAQIATLNVKAGIWGFFGGVVPGLVALIYFLMK